MSDNPFRYNPFRAQLERVRRSWVNHGPTRAGQACAGWLRWGGRCQPAFHSKEFGLLGEVIRENYPEFRGDRSWSPLGIAVWNDEPDRTQDEVEQMLEKAAVRWDEAHPC